MSQSHIPAEVRRRVRDRSGGRCEYCLLPESLGLSSHWIDHVVAENHGGVSEEGNLAYSCRLCNQHKGTDLGSLDPESGEMVRLFNPRVQAWSEHFRFVGAEVLALTSAGRVTIRLLQLNHRKRVQERAAMIAAGLLDSAV